MSPAALPPTPRVEVVWISPAMASAWLARNTHNRSFNRNAVTQYVRDMRANTWKLNGETIKFDVNGELLDGQHRLRACVEADTPFQSYVISGVSPQAFDTVDIGRKRTTGDALVINGEINTSQLAGALGFVWRYENQCLERKEFPTAATLLAYLSEHQGLRESVDRAHGHGHFAPCSVLAGLDYLTRQKDLELSEEFFEKLYKGEGLSATDPVHLLRERLLKNNSLHGRGRLQTYDIAGLFIKAWNATRLGQRLALLRFSPHGVKKEPFPEII